MPHSKIEHQLHHLENPHLTPQDLLETLLKIFAPRATEGTARDLLKRYKTVTALCQTPITELRLQKNIPPKFWLAVKVLHKAALLLQKERLQEKPLVGNLEALAHYSRLHLSPPTIEHCLVYYVDQEKALLLEEIHQVGTIDHLAIYPREIIRSALNCNARGLILAHNHPDGNPYPSNKDLIMTRKIKEMCKTFDLVLHDHLIIVEDGYYSFAQENAL